MLKTFLVISDMENDDFNQTGWIIFAYESEKALEIAQADAGDPDWEYEYEIKEIEPAPDWAKEGECRNSAYLREHGFIFPDDVDCEWCGERFDPSTDPHWHVNEEFNYCLDCESHAKDNSEGDIETVELINGKEKAAEGVRDGND
jgi:hypothetical protein